MIHAYDTLNFHKKERPGVLGRDLSDVPLPYIGQALEKALNELGQVHPEQEAVSFYLLNHVLADIQQLVDPDEPLGENLLGIVEKYHEVLNSAGHRLFFYLLAITTRESRHVTQDQHKKLASKHGYPCVNFTTLVQAHAQNAFFEVETDLGLGPYLDYLCDVFNTLTWSSAYGGPAWGKVTETLRDCVYGRISIEVMLDVGFTLAHNNGPIFNKGMVYYSYSMSDMLMILDCQRAGQIPNMVRAKASKHVTSAHDYLLKECQVKVPGFKPTPWVDWDAVQKLGAVGNYDKQKKETLQKYKNDPMFVSQHAAALAHIEKMKQQAAEKKALAEKQYLEILPGVKLKKVEKERG